MVRNAQALAAGLAGEGMRPVSGGTDTHLALIDLREVGVTGREAEARCDAAAITLNKNAIPYDPQKPMVASGIRVGTPSVTTQGMGAGEMRQIAGLIARAVRTDPERSGRARTSSPARRRGRRAGGRVPGVPPWLSRRTGRSRWRSADRDGSGVRGARSPGTRVSTPQTGKAGAADSDRHWRLAHLPAVARRVAAALLVARRRGRRADRRRCRRGRRGGRRGLVTVSYLSSTLVMAWADSVDPQSACCPFGLAMYVAKFSLLGVVLVGVADTAGPAWSRSAWGWSPGWSVWTGAHIWWVTTVHRPGRAAPAEPDAADPPTVADLR